jgi:hypothetical protein
LPERTSDRHADEWSLIDYDGAGNRLFLQEGREAFVDEAWRFEASRAYSYILGGGNNRLNQIIDPISGDAHVACVSVDGTGPGSGYQAGPTAEERRAHRCRVLALLSDNCSRHAQQEHGSQGWLGPCRRVANEQAELCDVRCPPGTEMVFGVLPPGVTPDEMRADFAEVLGLVAELIDNLEDQLLAMQAGDAAEQLPALQRAQAELTSALQTELDLFVFKYRVDVPRLFAAVYTDTAVSESLALLASEEALSETLVSATLDDIDAARTILSVAARIDIAYLLFGLQAEQPVATGMFKTAAAPTGGTAQNEVDTHFTYDAEVRAISEEIRMRAA